MPVHIKGIESNVAEPEPRTKIKLPHGAGPEIANFGSGSGSFLFTTEIMVAVEIFVNCYNFNPTTYLGQKNGN
jgi:hypothetical protein